MADHPDDQTTINLAAGSTTVIFREATSPEQILECYKLGALGFGRGIPVELIIKGEELLQRHPLIQETPWRIFSISPEDKPEQVLAGVRLMPRDVWIRGAEGATKGPGWCIMTVITHPDYRGHGLASFMLERVAAWMDAEGALMSHLHCTLQLSTFYSRLGWKSISSDLTFINLKSSAAHPQLTDAIASLDSHPRLRSTKLLSSSDVTPLYHEDAQEVSTQFATLPPSETTALTILPTPKLLSFQQARRDVLQPPDSTNISPTRGAICPATGTWAAWTHDPRLNMLIILRIRESASSSPKTIVNDVASLIVAAIAEARRIGIPQVLLGSPTKAVSEASVIIESELHIPFQFLDQSSSHTCIRLKDGVQGEVEFLGNEAYVAQ